MIGDWQVQELPEHLREEAILAFLFLQAIGEWMMEDPPGPWEDDISTEPTRMYVKKMWAHEKAALKVAPWKDGGHRGDCTKDPMTCMRCLVESTAGQKDRTCAKLCNDGS